MTPSAAPQRWTRPLDVEPGHWKKQLPQKRLRLAAKGDVDGLRALLSDNPEDLSRRGNHGRTLLWEAVKAGKEQAVRFLVEAGADVELTGCYNSESHVQITPYCAAHYYRRPALAAYLEDLSAEPDLFRQAFLGREAAVVAQIEAEPARLGAEDPHDEICFMPLVSFAVAGGHHCLTKRLISLGTEIEAYSAQLLFLAGKNGRADLLELLVAGGADTSFMETALIATKDIAVFRRLLELHRSTQAHVPPPGLSLAPIVRGDRAERLDKITALLDFGVPIEAPGPGGQTALHVACRARRLKVVALLLERGADPSARDDEGRTPLDIARGAHNRDAVTLLTGA